MFSAGVEQRKDRDSMHLGLPFSCGGVLGP